MRPINAIGPFVFGNFLLDDHEGPTFGIWYESLHVPNLHHFGMNSWRQMCNLLTIAKLNHFLIS